MRRATRVITLLAILGLVGLSLTSPAYAEGPRGNPAGVTNAGNPGPGGDNGPNGSTGPNSNGKPSANNGDGNPSANNANGNGNASANNANGDPSANNGSGSPSANAKSNGNPSANNANGNGNASANNANGNPSANNGNGNPSANGNSNSNPIANGNGNANGNGAPAPAGTDVSSAGTGGGQNARLGPAGGKSEDAVKPAAGGGKPEPDMSGKSSGPAAMSPPGNNGTIKVHQNQPAGHGGRPHGDVEVRSNMPHVRCTFHLYGFHFDANEGGTFWFEHWAPTGSGRAMFTENGVAKTQGTWTASAQGDWRSGTLQLEPGTRDHRHGSHYKLWSQGPDGHAKMKVFWQEPCEAAPPPPGGGQGSTTTETVCIEQPGMDIERTTVTTTENGTTTVTVTDVTVANCGEKELMATVTICIEQPGMDIERTTVTTTEGGETRLTSTDVDKDCGELDIEEEVTKPPTGNVGPGGEVTPPSGVTPPVVGGQNVRTEVVCIENMLVTRTFVNESLASVTSTGAVCVLGVEVPPLGAVTPIIEALAPTAQQLANLPQQLANVLGMLPSTATGTDGDARLAIAGLALIGAALLLLRKRAQRV